ncbi:MAG: class I tRNA ligase family protein, partial [Patescibacteria group bacterium]
EKFVGGPIEKEGILINSKAFDGMPSTEAREKITEKLKSEGLGSFEKKYRLHDWVLSRQRYWGVPIPMINCSDCGYQPVADVDLPIKLPDLKDFMPADDGRSPLAKAEKWLKVKCPKCGKTAERETDTMDTFVDSSWYFLRYTDPHNKEEFASKEKMAQWMPVPFYYGGAEHTTMHLLYSRFIVKALNSLGYLNFPEPFLTRRNRGIILGSDGHQKMSKSLGNVVAPDEYVAKYGADTVRMYLAFMGPYEQGGVFNTDGLFGVSRFLNRVWAFVSRHPDGKIEVGDIEESTKVINRAVKDMGEQIKSHKFNTGVSGLMKLFNGLEEVVGDKKVSKEQYEKVLLLIAPFAPHMAEELWQETLGNGTSVHLQKWPEFDEKLLAEELVSFVVQVNGKHRATFQVKLGLTESEILSLANSDESVKRALESKEVKKNIFIQDKLLNIVV